MNKRHAVPCSFLAPSRMATASFGRPFNGAEPPESLLWLVG